MTHHWEPDADTLVHYQLPKDATGVHHSYDELTPPDERDLRPDVPVTVQAQLVLANIVGDVLLREKHGHTDALDAYLFGFTPGPTSLVEWDTAANAGQLADEAYGGVPAGYEPGHNCFATYPLANLGKHADEHQVVLRGAAMLLVGGAS